MQIDPIDEAIEQPGIGGQRQRQHELIPEIAAAGLAVEPEGGGHQDGAHGEGMVGLPDDTLEGHKQEEQQEERGQPAHYAEQEAARPVGLLIEGRLTLDQIGGLQPLPGSQLRHETSVVVATSGWP
ncbi:hypothetical protein D3C72_1661060 [compost metagenome]